MIARAHRATAHKIARDRGGDLRYVTHLDAEVSTDECKPIHIKGFPVALMFPRDDLRKSGIYIVTGESGMLGAPGW